MNLTAFSPAASVFRLLRVSCAMMAMDGCFLAPRAAADNGSAAQERASLVSLDEDPDVWTWRVSGDARATKVVDTLEKVSGDTSFRIINVSPRQPHVYGVLTRRISGLSPNTTYSISFQAKGRDVSGAVVASGSSWENRTPFPRGSYDWQRLVHTFTTDAAPGAHEIAFIVDAPVGDLWIDEVDVLPAVATTDLVKNPGFDQGGIAPWHWYVSNGALATGTVDTEIRSGGVASFKIVNESPSAAHVYGALRQAVSGLSANTAYLISFRIKGAQVGGGAFVCGPGWRSRKPLPRGTYDWLTVTHSFTTGAETAPYELVFIADAPAGALWIDDVVIAPERRDESVSGI